MSNHRASNSETITGSSTPQTSFVRTTAEGRDIPAIGSAVPYQPRSPDVLALLVAIAAFAVGLGALIGIIWLAELLP